MNEDNGTFPPMSAGKQEIMNHIITDHPAREWFAVWNEEHLRKKHDEWHEELLGLVTAVADVVTDAEGAYNAMDAEEQEVVNTLMRTGYEFDAAVSLTVTSRPVEVEAADA